MSPWLFNTYVDAQVKEVKMGMRRMAMGFLEEGREWRLLYLFYADDLVLSGKFEEDLNICIMYKRRCLKVNAFKNKGMGRKGVRFQEERREWRLPCLLYADDLVLCGESEEDLRAMVECFVEVLGGEV